MEDVIRIYLYKKLSFRIYSKKAYKCISINRYLNDSNIKLK